MSNKEIIINQEIKAENVLVIFEDGGKKRMPLKNALYLAEKKGLDLVQVSSQEVPACKMIDYNKFLYQQNKRDKEQKKKQKQSIQELKEIRLSANIDKNDIKIKANQASKFLSENKRVKLTLKLKGRESKDYALNTIDNFLESLTYPYQKSQAPQLEGKIISMTINPERQ